MATAAETWPSRIALCCILTDQNHVDAVLLDSIARWARYGKARIPNVKGTWIANKREWWMREVQLSKDKLDRSFARLDKFELIERQQFWFGGRNILHVRPTQKTLNFLEAAKTWQAASEYSSGHGMLVKDSKPATVTVANSLNSNEIGKDAKQCFANSLTSNNSSNYHFNHNSNGTFAQPLAGANKSVAFVEKFQGEIPAVQELASHWAAMVESKYSVALKLDPKQIGILAVWLQSLAKVYAPNDQVIDLRPGALHIATYIIGKSNLERLKNLTDLEEGAHISEYMGSGAPVFDLQGCSQ